MKLLEDAVWTYFGYPNPYWAAKCASCLAATQKTKKPDHETFTCWHVELWERGPFISWVLEHNSRTFEEACSRMVELLSGKGLFSSAKVSRARIGVVRTGEPALGYPPDPVDRVFILYARSAAERDSILRALREWSGKGDGEPAIPVRMGCWRMDELLGDWRTWAARYPEEHRRSGLGS